MREYYIIFESAVKDDDRKTQARDGEKKKEKKREEREKEAGSRLRGGERGLRRGQKGLMGARRVVKMEVDVTRWQDERDFWAESWKIQEPRLERESEKAI